MRLLENSSSPELVKALIETKQKSSPKLVLLRVGLPAIFASLFGSGFVYILNRSADKNFEGAVLLLIFAIVFGIGLGLISALIIEHKLLKKAEETE
jgi:formate/nitrite transporter FocA (FNT family)